VSVSRITFRLNQYPQEALQIVASVWSRHPVVTNMLASVITTPVVTTMVGRGRIRIKTTGIMN